MNGIPAGWQASIDNNPDGNVHVPGGGVGGAAFLTFDELTAIRLLWIKDSDIPTPLKCDGPLEYTTDFAASHSGATIATFSGGE
jgi:hypothetical protein